MVHGAADQAAAATETGQPAGPGLTLRYPRQTMLVVGGIPGAGKSWLCNRLFTDGSVRVVDIDDFWPLSDFDEQGFEAAIDGALRSGSPLVVQLTALNPAHRKQLRRRAEKAGYQPHLLMLEVDAETAIAAQENRERRVPADRIRSYFSSWQAFKQQLESDDILQAERYGSIKVLDRQKANTVEIRFAAHGESADR